jgi:hypothetical protein
MNINLLVLLIRPSKFNDLPYMYMREQEFFLQLSRVSFHAKRQISLIFTAQI